jgi:hypothetical protein
MAGGQHLNESEMENTLHPREKSAALSPRLPVLVACWSERSAGGGGSARAVMQRAESIARGETRLNCVISFCGRPCGSCTNTRVGEKLQIPFGLNNDRNAF